MEERESMMDFNTCFKREGKSGSLREKEVKKLLSHLKKKRRSR